MADAKKCDRCGGLYEEYPGIVMYEGSLQRYNRVDIVSGSYANDYTKNDMCPKCMEAFKSFMKNGGTGNGEKLQ